MSLLPIFVKYIDQKDNNKEYQVPVVCFDPVNDLAIVVHERNFIKVPLSEIKFARWDN